MFISARFKPSLYYFKVLAAVKIPWNATPQPQMDGAHGQRCCHRCRYGPLGCGQTHIPEGLLSAGKELASRPRTTLTGHMTKVPACAWPCQQLVGYSHGELTSFLPSSFLDVHQISQPNVLLRCIFRGDQLK